MQKTSIFGHLGQKGPFWTVFDQNGKNENFLKKALGTFFSQLQALTNCKVSEKSNEGIKNCSKNFLIMCRYYLN